MLEADAVVEARRAPAAVGARRDARRRSPRATRAAAAASSVQRRNSACADGDAEVARQVRARGEREQHVAGRRVEPGRDEDDRADVRERRRAPTPRRARPRSSSAPRATSAVPRAPTPRAAPHERSSDARRRGSPCPGRPWSRGRTGGGRAACSAPRASSVRRSTPARHDDTQHRRHREHDQQHEHGVDRHRAARRDHDAAAGPSRASRTASVEVVQQEHLLAQQLQPVEVRGPFVVLDARDRGLQARDVRLDLDRRAVAEPHLDAVADRAQQPAARPRPRPRPRPPHDLAGRASVDAVGEAPSARARRRRRAATTRDGANDDDEQPRLGAVREPHRARHSDAPAPAAGRCRRSPCAGSSSSSKCSSASSSSSSSKRAAWRSNISGSGRRAR